jgi:hypothetical protein
MIEIGDLVKSTNTGNIGIVVAMDMTANNDYWLVVMHDSTYSIHKRRLTKLGEKNEQSN